MNTLTHDSLLFNIHDLVLVLAAAQFLLLAGLLVATRRKGDLSACLLAATLLVIAVQELDSLFIWSHTLRHVVLDWHPDLLFLGSFSYWLQGPLLYGFVASVLYKQLPLRKRYAWHLLPALVAGALLYVHYYSLPSAAKVAAMSDLGFMWTPLMTRLVTVWHLSVLVYGGASLWLLWRYRRQLLERYANVEVSERRWLMWMVLGFMLIAAWQLMVHLLGQRIGESLSNILGIASHYIAFIFVNALVFISIRYTHLFGGLGAEPASGEPEPYKPEQVARVDEYMRVQQPYLLADISLDTLAKRLSLPERTLSRILNQHFGKNFFEFINSYRVEQAKQLLLDSDKQSWTMLQVLAESGFTSKSTFNAIFKKQVGKTPSQYRKEQRL
ncbi:helix-turn-helix domain-containing protein [Gilvimarinus polysaccharolyticus]|uniref:helix-turn-helix domain-containing protein n=1 Tax=Gilvimarinus polysaccharolyticus TaxID=863921 RepID=UPI001E42EC05|nr:helix-turn-helix domain-containing protein [Gilvimarinus polysaccharolyticus]